MLVELEDIEVRFLKVYLPNLKVTDKCPPEEIKTMYKIRDNILEKLKN